LKIATIATTSSRGFY